MEIQLGDDPVPYFTFWKGALFHVEQDGPANIPDDYQGVRYPKDSILEKLNGQLPCYLTHTTSATADVVRANLHRSPLYSGVIQGVGPRYCPSIEDKCVKFPGKRRHQIFIEPEGIATEETLTGGEANTWGDYPVVCQFFADYRTQYTVSSANGHLYTGESIKNRRPIWFGYIGNGSWSWLGTGNDWTFDLAHISPHGSTLNPASMADKYDMPAQPLPQSWQSAVDQEHIDALLAELSKGQ